MKNKECHPILIGNATFLFQPNRVENQSQKGLSGAHASENNQITLHSPQFAQKYLKFNCFCDQSLAERLQKKQEWKGKKHHVRNKTQ